MRPFLLATVLGSAVLTLVSLPTAQAADPTYPTGTFHFAKASVYLDFDENNFDAVPYAVFELSMDSLTDDTTAGPDIVVRVDDGSGRPRADGPQLWPNTDAPIYLAFDSEGTYSPKVWLTDADHHTTVLDLPQVTVLPDYTSPYVRMTLPEPALRHRAAGWRVLRGVATDSGIGGASVHFTMVQKRGAYWYYLDTNYYSGPSDTTQSVKWVKGRKTLAGTRAVDKTYNSDYDVSPAGLWRSDPIPAMPKGTFVICYDGSDRNGNQSLTRCVTGRITHR